MLSLADADHILSGSSIQLSQVRLVRSGKEIPLEKLAKGGMVSNAEVVESLYLEYRNGATIVLPFLHERWGPLKRFCSSLALEFSAFSQINAYLTPANSRGFNTHYDTHDVFVVQTEGSKNWRLYEGPVHLPLRSQPYDLETVRHGRLLEEVELHAGDLLYIPRGCMHDATSGGAVSLHLTVGINTITWAELMIRAVESVVEKDSRFRESLPPGFAASREGRKSVEARFSELMAVMIEQATPEVLLAEAAQATLIGGQPILEGYLLDLEMLSGVNLQTRLRRRPKLDWRLSVTSKTVSIRMLSKTVHFPSYVEPALQFISQSSEFAAADIPGELDDAGKLVLIRSLIGEGFLTICRPLATISNR